MKYVVILGDGMADYPVKELGGKTPLELAKKPNIDSMAAKGTVGMVRTVPQGMAPGSDTANLSVMGYDPQRYYTGRSPLEAVSVGVPLEDDDITFRVNLVTLSEDEPYDQKTMIDYSSDEITTPEAKQLIQSIAEQFNDETFLFYPGFSYRHILVWKKGKLTFHLTPPHDISDQKITNYLPKGENSEILASFMEKSQKILKNHPVNIDRQKRGLRPANSLWIWGEGKKTVLPSFSQLHGVKGGVVSAVDLIKGIGISAGLTCPDVEGATGNIHTNFEGKAQAAIALLQDHDFVYVHLEAPDECGHRKEIQNKIKSIEFIDEKIVKPILDYLNGAGEAYRLLVMPDHPTPLELRTHVGDPVPFILYDSLNPKHSGITCYTEKECAKSGLFMEKGSDMMNLLITK